MFETDNTNNKQVCYTAFAIHACILRSKKFFFLPFMRLGAFRGANWQMFETDNNNNKRRS